MKLRQIINGLMIGSILWGICSCSSEEQIIPVLNLSCKEVRATHESQQQSFEIESNQKWKIDNRTSWCEFVPSEGEGNAKVILKLKENGGDTERKLIAHVIASQLKKELSIVQEGIAFKIPVSSMEFQGAGETRSLNIESNAAWSVNLKQKVEWCTVTPAQGEGNDTVKITVTQNTTHLQRAVELVFTCGNGRQEFTVIQLKNENQPPAVPLLKSPVAFAQNVALFPVFEWNAVTDPEEDEITYVLCLSTDGENWTEYPGVKSTALSFVYPFNENFVYYWKVKAKDNYQGVSESEVRKFTTGTSQMMKDGEVKTLQESRPTGRANIIFVGDGFVPADYLPEGAFEKAVNRAYAAYFDIEPFKTYKDYFNAYAVAAYSEQRGASERDKNIYKNTAFNVIYTGQGSEINVKDQASDFQKLGDYVRKIPAMIEEKWKTATVVLIVNHDRFAGTTYQTQSGRSIAICPLNESGQLPGGFENLIHHEGGGHGFGLLADEYVNEGVQLTEDLKKYIREMKALEFFGNIDTLEVKDRVGWKHFIGRPGYERVTVITGGYYCKLGLWHSESSACMINNMPYHNAISRELIVKRLMKLNDEVYSFENFLLKDIVRSPSASEPVSSVSLRSFSNLQLGTPPVLLRN